MKVVKACGVIAVPMGNDHRVEARKVDLQRLDVLLEDLGIVPCVEQYPFSLVFNEGAVALVSRESRIRLTVGW